MSSTPDKGALRMMEARRCAPESIIYFARVALHLAPPAFPYIELPFTRPVYWVPPALKLI